jgi:hypothetical protein
MNKKPTPKNLYQIKNRDGLILDLHFVDTVLVKWPSGDSFYCFTSRAKANKIARWQDSIAQPGHYVDYAEKGGVLI